MQNKVQANQGDDRAPTDNKSAGLTDDERRNGWTATALAKYRAEREAATDLTGGYVVTPFARAKQPPVHHNAHGYSAHRWMTR